MSFSQLLRGFILISPLAILLTAGNILSVKVPLKDWIYNKGRHCGYIQVPILDNFSCAAVSQCFSYRGRSCGAPAVCLCYCCRGACDYGPRLYLMIERFIFCERTARKVALTTAASVRPNTIYVGLPIVESVFGSSAVVLLSLYSAVAIPLLFTTCFRRLQAK